MPITASAHGTVLSGVLIAEDTYFAELVDSNPLLAALQPESGLLGKEYAKEVTAESGHHLHVRAAGGREEGLWRISLEAVDGWALPADAGAKDDKGPFARLLGT